MSILPGFVKHKRYHTNDDYTKSIISEWTREETIEMNDSTRTLNDIMDATNNKLNYGNNTIANGDNQTVLGKYNVADNNNKYARITGGGTAAERANIETLDWEGNVKFAGTVTTGNNINLNNLFDLVYPIGSLYWSKYSVDPSTLFGGTWTPVTDKFILAAGSQFPINTTGGATTTSFTYSGTVEGHNLTTREMPSHRHSFEKAVGVNDHKLVESEIPKHSHSVTISGDTSTVAAHKHESVFPLPIPAPGGTDDTHPIEVIQTDEEGHPTTTLRDTTEVGEHNHTINLSATSSTYGGDNPTHNHTLSFNSNYTGYEGQSDPHSHDISITKGGIPNMPPFVTYYCWERTA